MRTSMNASTQIQDLAPPICLLHPVLDASHKQQVTQGHKCNHKQTGCTDTPKHTISHDAAYQRKRTHLLPPECRHKSHPTRSPHKLLDKPYHEGRNQKEEFDLEAWKRKASNPISLIREMLLLLLLLLLLSCFSQSCPILCDPIDGNPPGSPDPGILQARILEWVAISFSNA